MYWDAISITQLFSFLLLSVTTSKNRLFAKNDYISEKQGHIGNNNDITALKLILPVKLKVLAY
jgi:hypothetical protein